MKCFAIPLMLLIMSGAARAQLPAASHVVVVVEENNSYSAVIGSANMPYLNSLAAKYGLATQYYANTHPSIGNYFMMTAGSLITNNDSTTATVTHDNIVRHLLTAGKTWKSYAESLPSRGYLGPDVYPYVRRHNPLSFFSDVVNSSVQRLNLFPFSQFSADLTNHALPSFSFIVPNLNHDAHDCPVAPTGCTNAQKLQTADAWLKSHIAPLLANSSFQTNGVLIIVFDEGFNTDTAHGGGHVAAVVIGPKVRRGFKSTTFYQHQNLLRTMLQLLGANTFPGAAASAKPMADLF